MIKTEEEYLVKVNRNSSKGNQLKWKKDNIWYKADYLGYEALAEYVVSALLEKSSVSDFVRYELTNVEYKEKMYKGCSSVHFLEPSEILITLPRLFQMYLDEDLYMVCESPLLTEADCAEYIVDNMEKITGICNFGEYLTMMLEVDAFFLNEDRHLHNIAVIHDEATEKFRLCPIFDNGGSLFSDTKLSYGMEKSVEECREIITARPFSPCFEDQVEAVERLYGKKFQYWFTEKDVQNILEDAASKEMYSSDVIERVRSVILEQMLLLDKFRSKSLDEKITSVKEDACTTRQKGQSKHKTAKEHRDGNPKM